MGTVEKIVDVLNKMCNDRKLQTSNNYEIHSLWLKNELIKVKELLNDNKNEGNKEGNHSNLNDINQTSLNDQNIKKEEDISEIRQKRKSPEISENISRGSPQIKRTSTDFNEILLYYNLPSDLNKLKKEELLDVLEKYGNKSMTMKSLKKDLIDNLKVLLIDLYYQKNQNQNQNINNINNNNSNNNQNDDNEDNTNNNTTEQVLIESFNSTLAPLATSVSTNSNSSLPLSDNNNSNSSGSNNNTNEIQRKASITSSPARKVSMLAEVRHQVRSSILQDKVESEEDRQNRLAKEYEARRNRSSQVRMSHVSNNYGQDDTRNRSTSVNSVSSTNGQDEIQENHNVAVEEEEEEVEIEVNKEQIVQPEIASDDEADDEVDEIVQTNDVKIEDEGEEEPDEGNSNWNEVPSPPPPTKPIISHYETTISSDKTKNTQDNVETVSSTSNDPTSSSFKLSNLVGGTQLSFLSNSSTSTLLKPKEKTVVPALQHAQKLKEKEEAKAAQKKKEIEEKKKEHMKKLQASSATSSVNVSSSKLFQSTTSKLTKPLASTTPVTTHSSSQPSTTTTSTATATPASTHVAPAPPLKKGFGWFRKDKDAIATPTAPAVATSLKASKDKLFTNSSSTTSNQVVKEEEEQNETVEDQENVKPFSSSISSTTPQFTSNSTVLTENKSVLSSSTQSKVIPPSTPSQQQLQSQLQSQQHKEQVPLTPQSESNSYEASPAPNQSPPQPQYQIDDRDDSDASDTDGDNDEQSVPDWAKPPKLRQALERQYGLVPGVPAVDPDTIFPEVQTCVLEEIFGRSQGKCRVYSNRTSSGKWDADELTLIEKRKYRHQMGYTSVY